MNQTQRNYVVQRLDSIRAKKVEEYEDLLIKEENKNHPGTLTVSKLLSGIKDNTIKVKAGVLKSKEVHEYTDIDTIFDIDNWMNAGDLSDAGRKKARAYDKELREEIERIQDELYLGDEKDAMELLRSFEKKPSKGS